LISRTEIEQRERDVLAPYACCSAESRGRRFPQEKHPLRTVFQRDRDRIVHCNAFRRMEFKTQVFLPHEGDHFRTRLTHTIEVAQITRTLARNLRLNEDLVEAIALVHDLGHTPFGHSGEDVLDELLADSGGFNHNLQSLRIVDLLEQHYPDHPGLNLTYEVREGIAKHETRRRIAHPDFDPDERPTLEASLVDSADEIAYNAHDVDDGLRSGLIELSDLAELTIFRDERGELSRARDWSDTVRFEKRYGVVRRLLNRTITDLLNETAYRLELANIDSLKSLRRCTSALCGYSAGLAPAVKELKEFLNVRLYRHPTLVTNADRARRIIRSLFERFMCAPEQMPKRYQEMLKEQHRQIVVADYIAGMTDRYAEQLNDS